MRGVDVPVVLSVAGSDPSGGAGIQADLKTFAAHRCYGAAAITALTVQNTVGVKDVHRCPPSVVGAQVEAVVEDLPVAAAKTGMLVDAPTIAAVERALRDTTFPLVVDPVLISKSGHALLDDEAVEALLLLLPRAALITPNLPEAERLGGVERLLSLGARAVLLKGGHADGDDVADVLFAGSSSRTIVTKRIATRHTHGTGCTLSAAIACGLARGLSVDDAVDAAIAYVHEAIVKAPGLGAGHGPLHHLHPFDAA